MNSKNDTVRANPLAYFAYLEWAMTMEFRLDNPCNRLLPVLGAQHDVVERIAGVAGSQHADGPRDGGSIDDAPLGVELAFDFLVVTAARWGEVRWAEWADIDRDEGVRILSATRTKSNRQHRVPLCGHAMKILHAARTLGEGVNPAVFTGRPGKPIDEKQLRRLLRKHKIATVPHGFRSSFRDWAVEETNHTREVIEAALAHVVRNKVEAAYA